MIIALKRSVDLMWLLMSGAILISDDHVFIRFFFASYLTNVFISHTSSKKITFWRLTLPARSPFTNFLALLRLLPPISDKNLQLDFQQENVLHPNISIFKNFEVSRQRSLVSNKGDSQEVLHPRLKGPHNEKMAFFGILVIVVDLSQQTYKDLVSEGCRGAVGCREIHIGGV